MSTCQQRALELAESIVRRFAREHPTMATWRAHHHILLIALTEANQAFARCEAKCRENVIYDERARCLYERAKTWKKTRVPSRKAATV